MKNWVEYKIYEIYEMSLANEKSFFLKIPLFSIGGTEKRRRGGKRSLKIRTLTQLEETSKLRVKVYDFRSRFQLRFVF